jgi:hypothetical protein
MTLEGLHQFAVEHPRFRLSGTRRAVMKNLWTVAGALCRWGISCKLWIDGSFLTEKIDPHDVDFVVVLPENFHDAATPEQLAILEWLCEDIAQPAKKMLLCDAYALYEVSPGDPGYTDYLLDDALWKKTFGTSRQHEPKGMVVVALPEGDCV